MTSNYGWGLPVGASSYAKDIDFGIYLIHGAMLTIFVLWSIFFVYLLVKYKKREGVPAQGEEHESFWGLLPDIAVTIFEIGLIAFYAIPVWSRIRLSGPPAPMNATNRIEILAEQFAWNVHYPGPDGKFGKRDPKLIHFNNPMGLDPADPASADDIVSANELHLPIGKPTVIDMTSKDVIHSFFIPEFRVKQDIVPGMKNTIWVEPTLEGTFELACAQLCGFGHSLMRGDVFVQSEAAYQAWLASKAKGGK